MSNYAPAWEDRGFRAWLVSRGSKGASLLTILLVITLREVFPLARLIPGDGSAARAERVVAWLLAFTAVYVIVGYAWYRLRVKPAMRQPIAGR